MPYHTIPLTDDLIPFIHHVYEQNRDVLHGAPIPLEKWQTTFGKHADPDEANFIVMNEALPIAWLKLNSLQKSSVHISMLIVDKAYHHQGAGHFALQFAEAYAQCHAKSAIIIHTTKDNSIAIGFYLKHGYLIIREIMYPAGGGPYRAGYEFQKTLTSQH